MFTPQNFIEMTARTRLIAMGIAGLACLFPLEGVAEGGKDGGGATFFERRVRPILVEHCYECHSEAEDERKGGLLLDRETGWLEGGDSGKAVVPGNLDGSLLIAAVRYADSDLEMPPKYELDEGEVKLLEQWVARGAPGPADDMGDTEFSQLGDQEFIFGKAREHWAFRPLAKVEPVEVDHPRWNGTAIDRLLYTAMAEEGLSPSPRAGEAVLKRRLAYDLTGLPPAGGEGGDLEGYVDDLLGSPRFGEHFARMWLDVARYADTANTYRADTKTPHYYPWAFTYRDYVIEAFNEDKPYGEFVKEQLAADLMGLREDAPELAALGFIGVSPYRDMSDDFVDDAIDVTFRGFLGMTAACARCHDHKYEPIPTADYYSLYGVFRSVKRPAPWDVEEFPVILGYDPGPKQESDYEMKRAAVDEKIVEAGDKKRGGNNRSVAEEIRQTELAELFLFHDGAPARAMSVKEAGKPVEPAIFIRGEPGSRGDRVPRRFLKILDEEQTAFPAKASGRMEIAERIVDEGNPLTARVFVNRVWGALMGTYLVDTPSDFGLQGSGPSHPELLDWLAGEFLASGGSLKHLVKVIVSSEAYRQRSRERDDMAANDPENVNYWRANSKRLTIEELRDSLLAVSGELDLRMRGRSAPLWGEGHTKRRSVYGYINRFNLDPTLRNFDFPSPIQSQGKRTEDIVAPQALFTMNSPFVIDRAKELVASLDFGDGVNRQERIDAIFERVLQRKSDEGEREKFGRFIDLQRDRGVHAWPLVAQAVMMSNEFLYVD
ncbi:MAG: PSD1 and planctomycete cytochrome C domain-containing protein [Verrucomicrobiota bacterium]